MTWITQRKNWVRHGIFILILVFSFGSRVYKGDGVSLAGGCYPVLLFLSAGHYCVTGVDSTMIWIYSGLSNASF
jgi:hypothetical protein